MYYCNPTIESLYRVFAQNNREGYLRLDLNENPGGLPEDFIASALQDVSSEFISKYPETDEFTIALADYLNTDEDHICLVNGSAEGIRYIIQAFTSFEGRVVCVAPAYFMYHVYSEMYDRTLIEVNYEDDLSFDINKIISELNQEVQLLILMNPNNPMGNAYSEEEFEKIMNAAADNQVTVVIDEAYYYFYKKTVIKYALERQHVFVTRTFSKFFSMAGCRLGYVIGWPEGIKMIQNLCTPHNTNAFALLFAKKVINSPEIIEKLQKEFDEGKEYLIQQLMDYGYQTKNGEGNFIFIKPNTDAESLVEEMRNKKNILVKVYHNVGYLGDCLRVTIGKKEYMEQFVEALVELDKI